MAMLPSVFQAEGKGDMGFEVLEPGWYLGAVQKSELMDTKAGTGKYLKLQFKLYGDASGGDNGKGRMVWQNLNLINPNQQAVEIAERELATLCRACGLEAIEDSVELHDIEVGILLAIQPATAQWPAKNIIKGYAPADAIPTNGGSNGNDIPF